MTHHKSSLLIALAAITGLAGPAMAQAAGVPTPAPAAGAGALGNQGGNPDVAGQRAKTRVEQHITELRKRLAITPAQQPQWDAFATVMRQNAQDMERNYQDRQARGAITAVEDMRGYATVSRLHADSVARLQTPFEALYATMSPEQKAAADKTFQNFQRGTPRRGA